MLYKSTVNGLTIYTTDSRQLPSQFTRRVTFDKATLNGQELSAAHVLKMTVRVWYMSTAPDRAVVLETYLAAWEKTE